MNFKFPGSTPYNDTIINGTQHNTWIYNESDSFWEWGHRINVIVDYPTNTIKMFAMKNWEELRFVDETDRFRFVTGYYTADGFVQDYAESPNGSAIVNDLVGDVPYNFIDIVQGSLNVEPEEVVTFPNPNLESAIREALCIRPDANIYRSELEELTTLHAESMGISNLTGLEYLTKLIKFGLMDNQISDISPSCQPYQSDQSLGFMGIG